MGKLFTNFPKQGSQGATFQGWLDKNAPDENPIFSDYDYYGAYLDGLSRDGVNGHFSDRFKLPFHPTFSNESSYYRPGMPANVWDGDNPVPAVRGNALQQYLIDRSRRS